MYNNVMICNFKQLGFLVLLLSLSCTREILEKHQLVIGDDYHDIYIKQDVDSLKLRSSLSNNNLITLSVDEKNGKGAFINNKLDSNSTFKMNNKEFDTILVVPYYGLFIHRLKAHLQMDGKESILACPEITKRVLILTNNNKDLSLSCLI